MVPASVVICVVFLVMPCLVLLWLGFARLGYDEEKTVVLFISIVFQHSI